MSSPLPFPTHAPQIFDRRLRALRQRNRLLLGDKHPLHAQLYELLLERPSFIKRQFETGLIIGDFTPPQGIPNCQNILHLNSISNSVGDSEFLPFRPNTFDLVISYFDLHMVNDIPGVLAQINQILKPDGLFLGVFLGGDSLWQLRRVCQEVEMDLRKGASPRVAPMVALYDAAALLQRAGFALPVADHEVLEWEYDSAMDMVKDLKALGLSNCLIQQQRDLMGKDLFQGILQMYEAQFGKMGHITCCFDVVFLSGWRPSPTQQKPLPRGSATLHLSQVL